MEREFRSDKRAMIVLHEIYGVNEFIQNQCQRFRNAGYDVFCPNIIGKPPFSYEESKTAYNFFIENIGFEVYKGINDFVNQLKRKYNKVFIIGFSVGATIAWRCCQNSLCSGIIACYGSRIRDYNDLIPVCPTLLLFAKKDSFDVHAVIYQLQNRPHLSVVELDAEHGFMDCYSKHFNFEQSKHAEELITKFINKCAKCLHHE